MPTVPVVPVAAIRRAQESRNREWQKALDQAGITEQMEASIVPPGIADAGLFDGLKAINAHQEILSLAVSESRSSGKTMTAERLQQIAADYRAEHSWRGKLRRLISG